MSESVNIELSAEEARILRDRARDRHNKIARAQQTMFEDSAELSETKDISTRKAVDWVIRKELSEGN